MWRRVEISGSVRNPGGTSGGIVGRQPGSIVERPGKGRGVSESTVWAVLQPPEGMLIRLTTPSCAKGDEGGWPPVKASRFPVIEILGGPSPLRWGGGGMSMMGKGRVFPAPPASQLLGPATGHR